jgi:demethylmenaquinone methyltransferase/2-methoxy-6-polyprenyl-1,4-benzoquinol methylase
LRRYVNQDAWRGPRPLPNPLDVPRLSEIYSRTAAFYDGVVAERQAGPKLEALRRLNRLPGERFLEVGAGTGWAFARVIAASGRQDAYALDVASGMLEVARQRLAGLASEAPTLHSEPVQGPEAPATTNEVPSPSRERVRVRGASVGSPAAREIGGLPLLLGDARSLPFADAALDCLLITYTFEVLPLPDIAPVLDECLRVLRHGGRIAVVNLTEGEGAGAAMTDDWKRRYQDDPEYFGGARPLQLQAMLEARGFVGVSRTYVGPSWPSEVLLAQRP